jgi:hypothetical protein
VDMRWISRTMPVNSLMAPAAFMSVSIRVTGPHTEVWLSLAITSSWSSLPMEVK